MGSGQSSSATIRSPDQKSVNINATLEESNHNTLAENKNEDNTSSRKKKSPPPNLSGFDLIQYKCRKKKRAYDMCHSSKHKAFVGGKKLQDDEGEEQSCEDLFDIYKECIYKGMYQDRKKRGIKAPAEESALGTYAEYADEE